MMIENGFIKLHRKFTRWEWYDNITVKTLFLHLLLTVNYEERRWQGLTIKRGERASSYAFLAAETGLTVKQVREALKKLESSGEIACQTTNKYTLIRVNNYAKYQDIFTDEGNQMANEGQTKGNQMANEGQTKGNNERKIKKDKERKKNYILLFERFWSAYPRKQGKADAIKAFDKLDADDFVLSEMLSAIEKQKQSAQWKEGRGKYIPMPATWLNGRRWEDELPEERPKPAEPNYDGEMW